MKYNVQPLRTDQEISEFLAALGKLRYGPRNQYLFLLGINTGLRIGDLLNLRISDLQNDQPVIQEQKTGKLKYLFLKNLHSETALFVHNRRPEEYAFLSRSGRQLTTNAVYRIFETAGHQIGRTDIGTHTMRKTFGYHYYQLTHDIGTLMMIFNHSSEQITKRYIGLNYDEVRSALATFRIG